MRSGPYIANRQRAVETDPRDNEQRSKYLANHNYHKFLQKINQIRRISLQSHCKRAVEDYPTVGREKRGVTDFLPFWVLYSASSGTCGNSPLNCKNSQNCIPVFPRLTTILHLSKHRAETRTKSRNCSFMIPKLKHLKCSNAGYMCTHFI